MTDMNDIQRIIGETNGKNGFNEYQDLPEEHRAHYLGSKLMLVASELAEAQDEIRNGRAADEVYLSGGGKPEGFLVEMADAVIRLFGIAYEVGGDLPALIEQKMEYNSTRPYKHNKQF